ncbi:MAG: MBL fold metallo-hydrolase [Clostridia bacterium]|nr:MBL fold metallo-hydrolase [Clostridia bacterium]
MEFTTQKIAENLWALDQKGVRSFFLVGQDNAVLVDTCFGGDILSVCRTLTDNPITLITTHSDGDHCGCDAQFTEQYMHPAEFARYESRGKGACKAKPISEGDVFNVGEYTLEVIVIPGHTPGSIALLDRQHKFLISGDTVQSGCIFMHGDGRDLPSFRESIIKLDAMRREGLFDTVYPAHGDAIVPADILEDHLALADEVLSGTAVPAGPAPEWFPDTVKTYRSGRAQMYYAVK